MPKSIVSKQGVAYLVDDEDYEFLSKFNWSTDRAGYARRSNAGPSSPDTPWNMHRIILGLRNGDGIVADHKDGNICDNRRENLRKCTPAENSRNQRRRTDNSSGYKGVQWMKAKKKWQAKICVNRVQKHLGLFNTPEEAHAAYCEAAAKLHGDFSNFGDLSCKQERYALA